MNTLTKSSVFLIFLLCWQLPSQALDSVFIQIEHWATEQLQTKDFVISFKLTEQGLATEISAQSLSLAEPLNQLKKVTLTCPQLKLKSNSFSCARGHIQFDHDQLGQQSLPFSLQARPEDEQYQLQLMQLKLANGEIDLAVAIKQHAWTMNLSASQLQLSELMHFLQPQFDEQALQVLSKWQYDAKFDVTAQLTGYAEQVDKIQSRWQLSSLNLTNEAGSIVTEGVALGMDLQLAQKQHAWSWQVDSQINHGQGYAEPIFLDFSEQLLSLTSQGQWDRQSDLVDITQLMIEHPSLQASLTATIKQTALVKATVLAETHDLAQAYPIWLQPLLLGTAAENLNVSGHANMRLSGNLKEYVFTLQTDGLSIDDQQQRYQLDWLKGDFAWSTGSDAVESQLSWQQAQLYALELGAVEFNIRSQNNSLTLIEPVDLPVLDGVLSIDQFSLQRAQNEALNWSFAGQLSPISMESLSSALGWPLMHGKLSGVIPKVHYQQQQLVVDGALEVNLFDGQTRIRDLRLSSPLGALPQLYANIDVNNLELELLTQTFDFGRMSGRIDGYVHNLRLSNWEPVYFDAVLATDEEMPGKRRISQKAVDNLSQIGGGASGVLAGSFLRFFDDFSYKKLGLSCQLRNEVCEMSGVEPAQPGYYIVKGGGALPPWINVVGYTHRVDWSDLVARLKAVSESDGPVIE